MSTQVINGSSQVNALPRYANKASKKEKSINVNGLEKVASTLLKKSETTLSKERLTNTVRRADMAENIKSNARKELRLAKTILNLVEAIKAGKSKYLAGIRSRSQVQALEYILRAGKSNRSRYLKHSELDSKDREVEILDINFVKYPYPWITKHNFKQLNLLGQKITGLSGFLVDLNILFTLDLKKQDSDKLYFDNDQKLWLLRDTIQKLKTSDHHVAKDMADFLVSQSQDCELLQNLGIKDLHTLIKALEEYFQYRSNQIQEDPVKRLERELIGLKIPNYFPTPKDLIEKMLDLANIDNQQNLKILEPSAGSGHLADEIKKRAINSDLSVIEINHHLKEILEAKGYNLVARDFLFHKEQYSRIIMNPPFSAGQDMEHLQHAYELLCPGGRVVSIMGESSFFRSDKKALEFREWFESVGGYNEKLSNGAFLNSDRPTNVSSRIVVIDKPHRDFVDVDTSLSLSETNNELVEKEVLLVEEQTDEVSSTYTSSSTCQSPLLVNQDKVELKQDNQNLEIIATLPTAQNKEVIKESQKISSTLSQEENQLYLSEVGRVVEKMIGLAGVKRDMKVLTSDAGSGDLSDRIKRIYPDSQVYIVSDIFDHEKNYDYVFVFCHSFTDGYDASYFYQGYHLLVPGGKLFAIISEESFSSNFDCSRDFKKWFKGRGGSVEELSDGTLIDRKTYKYKNIPARLIVVNKSSLF